MQLQIGKCLTLQSVKMGPKIWTRERELVPLIGTTTTRQSNWQSREAASKEPKSADVII